MSQGLFKRYVPGLSELLHTNCSTMAAATLSHTRFTAWNYAMTAERVR